MNEQQYYRLLAEIKPKFRNPPKDHTQQWSRLARRKHRYNRMDPDPEPESEDEAKTRTKTPVKKDPTGKIKLVLTKEDWKKFWVDRLRRIVDAPHLTDKDIIDAVERERRIFLRQREENRKLHVDPDIPSCFYWNKFEVADWIASVNFPQAAKVKEMFLHFGICGRHLVTLDANKLLKMGLFELGTIKAVTKAVRGILGLPHTNGLRAMARVPPLETFLKLKVRTGPIADKFTFKEFCEEQTLQYEPLKKQMADSYQPIPSCCRVEIRPDPKADVKWIPVTPLRKQKRVHSRDLGLSAATGDSSSNMSSTSGSSSDDFLDEVPTVEELTTNAYMRNAFIPQILNDIVEAVHKKVAENKRLRKEELKNKQRIADEVMKDHLGKAFADFHITDPEDKLKFVTIIAEELVEDILRAREILEDIDTFQKKIKNEIPEDDMKSLQEAVAYYVQNIMTVVVSSALREMEESSTQLHRELNGNDVLLQDANGSESSGLSDDMEEVFRSVEQPEENEDFGNDEMEVIWDRTFNDEEYDISHTEL